MEVEWAAQVCLELLRSSWDLYEGKGGDRMVGKRTLQDTKLQHSALW